MEKETIELVKKMIEDGNLSQEIAEKYFPELKGSKKGRIKKSFTRLIKASHDVNFPTPEGFTREEMLDYLEESGNELSEPIFKVGEFIVEPDQRVYMIRSLDMKNQKYEIMSTESGGIEFIPFKILEDVALLWTMTDAKPGDILYETKTKDILIFKGQCLEDKIETYFSYMGGENHTICGEKLELKPATKNQRDTILGAISNRGYSWNLDELELAKQKFKIGDWIISDVNGNIYHIIEIDLKTGAYYVELEDGDKYWYPKNTLDSCCRLWDTEDANHGDILVISRDPNEIPMILILRDYISEVKGIFYSVCYTNRDKDHTFIEGGKHYLAKSLEIYPANKEQRDLLFKKMKEAGYEWEDGTLKLVKPLFKVGDIIENKKSEDIVTIEKVSIEKQLYFFKHWKNNGTKEFHGNFEFKDQGEWKLITEEKILVHELVVICENLKTDKSNRFTLDTINKVSSFLQDLRDGYINLELTKEDEAKLRATLSYINMPGYVSTVYTKEAVSYWLKSKLNLI